MAHKTRVGGTNYEVKGGRTLVNGTGYSIQKGRTRINGTGYDVLFTFTPYPVPVRFTGTGGDTLCYALINGVKYYDSATVVGVEVMTGDVITLAAAAVPLYGTAVGDIMIDGVEVATIATGLATYEWTVPNGISQITINFSGGNLSNRINVYTS